MPVFFSYQGECRILEGALDDGGHEYASYQSETLLDAPSVLRDLLTRGMQYNTIQHAQEKRVGAVQGTEGDQVEMDNLTMRRKI